MAIECLILGAGQEVGKSCVVAKIGGKQIMFDCGMHMGYSDHRAFPDFSLISPSDISCVVITHFHLDHIGALPYFTEVCGYNGPIYMTYPTKALAPLMLKDYHKIMVDKRGLEEQYSCEHILQCMDKVIPIDIKQTIQVDKDLQIRAYYAGHVIGAAMIYAQAGEETMVYTGDYNMTPDRHLGAAQIDRLQLDLLITESTYATTIRDSKYSREREFLKAVHTCVAAGGKVLIPTFALGRAQRDNSSFFEGLTLQANMYYKMLIGWTSQKIKESYTVRNPFDFKHVCPFERSMINAPGPCILFATPGMLGGGFSLEVFKQWAPSDKNLIALPGYCIAGTVGHKLMSGKPTRVDLEDTQIDVKCQIHQLAFSPHTDSKGIMDLVEFLSPKHVILVHGEKPKMASLKQRIESELGIPCQYPANHETALIPTTKDPKIVASKTFIKNCTSEFNGDERIAEGILIMEKGQNAKFVSEEEFLETIGIEGNAVNAVTFTQCLSLPNKIVSLETEDMILALEKELKKSIKFRKFEISKDCIKLDSITIRICSNNKSCNFGKDEDAEEMAMHLCCSWSIRDDEMARICLSVVKNMESTV
ncbi:cleavage and polyadenylation specificity factor subunit 3-II [Carex littledalei]|uniref:Cleavage and polyadenylation specificity factor subunit 3-II n=1 Tax=Carex littledalei TaxID=544730 RepID=A0A833R918_9POAL|nr:cleavage and polyadenylation specificity factor subunit 3-II [Carex littledalei]